MKNQEVGLVKKVNGFLIYLDGLPSAKLNELVENETGTKGFVTALMSDETEILALSSGLTTPGQIFKPLNRSLSVLAGDFLPGRIIDPLGAFLDNQTPPNLKDAVSLPLESTAPGLAARKFIKEQFETGITLVDSLIPLGKGQREVIMGDARSGKLEFLLNLIINQKGRDCLSIFAAIGKPLNQIKNLSETLLKNQAMANTIIIAAPASASPPLIFLAPKTAFAVAEYFQKKGRDVLLILDDMASHARAYREISLLSGRIPGRESYPGDVFFQHASLLERAGCFTPEAGGGSITALPAIELNLRDFTTYITTNLLSITDGHLLFRASLYNQAQRPAIDFSLSVSRVGSQTQFKVQNLLATRLKQILTEAGQIERISRFSSELSAENAAKLRQKIQLLEIFKQDDFARIDKELQVILLALPLLTFFEDKEPQFLAEFKPKILSAFKTDPDLAAIVKALKTMSSEEKLIAALEAVKDKFVQIAGPLLEDNNSKEPPPEN